MARNTDWSIGWALTKLEEYNGLGYAARGLPSPYLWSGTDQYKSGKYVRDGVYDPNAVDSQFGCAGLLKAMAGLDPTAILVSEKSSSVVSDAERASSTIAWGYILAIVSGLMSAVDNIGDALGDPNLREQINNAIGDTRVAGRILLGISIITILARLRSLRKAI